MATRKVGSFIIHLQMPKAIKNSKFEYLIRFFASRFKHIIRNVEDFLRRGRIKCQLPSVNESILFDYNFAIKNLIPENDKLLSIFYRFLQPGQVVYDIGGFVGWYTLIAAKKIQNLGKVITFEPVPETADLLRRHIRLNKVEDRVRVIEAACSYEFGIISMPVWPIEYASGNGLFNVHPRDDIKPNFIPISVVKLDDYCLGGGASPSIIKVDVEGAELWVLQGAKNILKNSRPLVFLEIHAFAWNYFHTTEQEFRKFLQSVSYDILEITSPIPLTNFPERGHALLKPSEMHIQF